MLKDKILDTVKQIFMILANFLGLAIVVILVWLGIHLAKVTSVTTLNSILAQIGWPLIIILFGLIYMVPIYRTINGLASKLSTATTVKIGDIEFHTETLRDIIIEREKLRTGIYMASVDKNYSKVEFQFLRSIEMEMPSRLDDLADTGRMTILETAVLMGCADDKLNTQEYEALKNLAGKFKVPKTELDKLIVETVIEKHVEGIQIVLPSNLQPLFEQIKSKREIA